jgi:hypothetical protein
VERGGEAESLRGSAPTPGVLTPIDQSGVRGRVALEGDEGEWLLLFEIEGLEPGESYTAHVSEGRCAAGGPVVTGLGDLTAEVDGTGSLRAEIESPELDTDEGFVQIHDRAGEPVSCADLPDTASEAGR